MDRVLPDDIGHRIYRLRRVLGVKQRELADYIGISPALLCRMEYGDRRVREHNLEKICRALRVTIEDICKPEEEFQKLLTALQG